ncbi:hypothetical protein D3C75_1366260 [compost metagenome]
MGLQPGSQQISYGFFEIHALKLHQKIDWTAAGIRGKVIILVAILKQVQAATLFGMKSAATAIFKEIALGLD